MVHFVSCLFRIAEKHGFSHSARIQGVYWHYTQEHGETQDGGNIIPRGLKVKTCSLYLFWINSYGSTHIISWSKTSINCALSWMWFHIDMISWIRKTSSFGSTNATRFDPLAHRSALSAPGTTLGVGRRPRDGLGSIGVVSQVPWVPWGGPVGTWGALNKPMKMSEKLG